jgi:hypothetical protein
MNDTSPITLLKLAFIVGRAERMPRLVSTLIRQGFDVDQMFELLAGLLGEPEP